MAVLTDGLLAVTALGAGAIAYRAVRNRPRAGTTPLAGMLLGIGLWAAAHLGAHHTAGVVHVGFEKLLWTGIAPFSFLWTAFVLQYTGREGVLTQRNWLLLAAWPAVLVALLWLPASVPVSVWPQLAAERGVFWAHIVLSYGLLGVGSVLLVAHLRSVAALFRRQGLLVLTGLTVGWAGSVVSVFELLGDIHLHALPVGFALMSGFMLWAVLGSGLTRVAPIARSTVIERLAAGVVVLDADRQVTGVNPAARELLGLDPDEPVVGRDASTLFGDHPDLDALLGGDGIENADGGDVSDSEASSSDSVDADGGVSETVRVGDRVLECERTALRDDRGRFVGWSLLLYDLTQQRRREAQLERQNERLEKFTSALSHDLRNPLNVAQGQVELARTEADGETPHLEAAERAHDRMAELVDDLLTLARQGEDAIETTPVALPALVERSWSSVPTGDAELAEVPAVTVRGDPQRLRQLFENLFRNSVEHGSTGSRPESDDAVEHGSTDPDASVTVRVGELPDGFYVADDGSGFDGDPDGVLEPGYSTTDTGTGLGLSIVEEIAAAHGWEVRVTESESGGARFEFTGASG